MVSLIDLKITQHKLMYIGTTSLFNTQFMPQISKFLQINIFANKISHTFSWDFLTYRDSLKKLLVMLLRTRNPAQIYPKNEKFGIVNLYDKKIK